MEPYQQLEKTWGEKNGYSPDRVVACSSGTAALHLAFESFRLPPGAEVIVPDFAMIACARAVSLAGLVPVFADIGSDLNLDPSKIAQCVTRRTRAVLIVHTYGRRANVEEIGRAMTYRMMDLYGGGGGSGLFIVEDLAEAHGVTPDPRTDAACWSFYRNKIVAGEEGGAIAYREGNKDLTEIARSLRSLGFTEAHDFVHRPRGCNYRMANALASLILPAIEEMDANVVRRRRMEFLYNVGCPDAWKLPAREAPWVYDLRIPGLGGEDQDKIVQTLNAVGIAARHGFKPLRNQQEYRNRPRETGPRPRNRTMWDKKPEERGEWESDRAAREVIYLPLLPGSTGDVPDIVFAAIRSVLSPSDLPSNLS